MWEPIAMSRAERWRTMRNKPVVPATGAATRLMSVACVRQREWSPLLETVATSQPIETMANATPR